MTEDLRNTESGPTIPKAPPLKKLSWQPARMVRWLDPRQLAGTAVRSILADAFGEYADKREMQAALHPGGEAYDYTAARRPDLDDELWIDYVADLGDGFDSTYAVAYALSRPYLERSNGIALVDSGPQNGREEEARDHPKRLRRGNILVMGGDQVYPVPSREEYEQRLVGPYRAAMSWDFAKHPADLYAVPGNHDWYDGLTTFLRLFCTRPDWVGGWRVPQRRSYFALKLPHNWWLLGVDIALTSRIDEPQLEYFDQVAKLAPGDKVILVTAQPSWVEYARGHKMGYENLTHFEERCVLRHGASVALTLTGDLHHYVRYTKRSERSPSVDPSSDPPVDDRRHKIISGGGGAYLYPTHHLDQDLQLPDPASPGDQACFDLAQENVYPTPAYSRWRGVRAPIMVPWLNKWFTIFLGCVYAVFVWVLQSSVHAGATNETEALLTQLSHIQPGHLWEVLKQCSRVAAHSPASIFIGALVVLGCIAFAKPERQSRSPKRQAVRRTLGALIGAAHGLGHLAIASLGLWATVRVSGMIDENAPYRIALVAGAGLAFIVLFGLLGSIVMGIYLAVTSVLPFVALHWNESFSAQAIKDRKNFVRMRIDRSGTLHVYSVGLDTVPRKWDYHEGATNGAPWFTPTKPLPLRIIDRLTLSAPRPAAQAPDGALPDARRAATTTPQPSA